MRSVPSDRVVELNGFITAIVKTIVDHPEGVNVHVIPTSHRIIVELHTDASDVGQVVGSGGRVVSAVRTLLSAYGGKHKFKVDLDYVTEKNNLAPFRD